MVGTKTDRINQNKGVSVFCINILPIFKLLSHRAIIFEITYVSCMLVWCDLHVARNVSCTAISCAVVYKHARFSKTLGTSHKIHVCAALVSVKFKSSCTVYIATYSIRMTMEYKQMQFYRPPMHAFNYNVLASMKQNFSFLYFGPYQSKSNM